MVLFFGFGLICFVDKSVYFVPVCVLCACVCCRGLEKSKAVQLYYKGGKSDWNRGGKKGETSICILIGVQ